MTSVSFPEACAPVHVSGMDYELEALAQPTNLFEVDSLNGGRLILRTEDGRKFVVLTDTTDEPGAFAELDFEDTDETGIPQDATLVTFSD